MIRNKASRFVYAGLFLILFPSSAFSKIEFCGDLTLVSKYIWRGFDTISDDRPAIQPSCTLNFGKSGFWLNLWSAIALADTNFVEADVIAGYSRDLFDRLTLSAGGGYYTFPSLTGWPDRSSTTPEIYTGITVCFVPFSPTWTIYYDFNLGDGIYSTFSLNQLFQIKNQTLNPSITVGYTNQYHKIGVEQGWSDINFGVSADFALKNITISPSVNYVIVPNQTINDENEFWVGLKVCWATKETD